MHYDYDDLYFYSKKSSGSRAMAEISGHLAVCGECRKKLAKVSGISASLRQSVPVPGSVLRGIKERTGMKNTMFGFLPVPKLVFAMTVTAVMFLALVAVKQGYDSKKDTNVAGFVYDTYETVMDYQYNDQKYLEKISLVDNQEGEQL